MARKYQYFYSILFLWKAFWNCSFCLFLSVNDGRRNCFAVAESTFFCQHHLLLSVSPFCRARRCKVAETRPTIGPEGELQIKLQFLIHLKVTLLSEFYPSFIPPSTDLDPNVANIGSQTHFLAVGIEVFAADALELGVLRQPGQRVHRVVVLIQMGFGGRKQRAKLTPSSEHISKTNRNLMQNYIIKQIYIKFAI
jgi:hypothetical protein